MKIIAPKFKNSRIVQIFNFQNELLSLLSSSIQFDYFVQWTKITLLKINLKFSRGKFWRKTSIHKVYLVYVV